MPSLVRLYVTHAAIGFAVSFVFTTAIVAFDIGRVGYLVSHVEGGWLAAFLFFMLNGIVFAGVQFGIAVMRMAGSDDETPRGGSGPLRRSYATVPLLTKRREG